MRKYRRHLLHLYLSTQQTLVGYLVLWLANIKYVCLLLYYLVGTFVSCHVCDLECCLLVGWVVF